MLKFEQQLATNPQAVSARVRANRDRRLLGAAGPMGHHPSTRAYLIQEVPFNGAKTAAHLLFSMADAFDLMQQGQCHRAEAHMALTLAPGQQAAMDDWRWHNASRLILQPAPPFHALINVQGSTLPEPLSHLADPGWIGAAMSYAKDLAVFKEVAKSSRSAQAPPPKGNRLESDEEKKKRTKGKGKGEAGSDE